MFVGSIKYTLYIIAVLPDFTQVKTNLYFYRFQFFFSLNINKNIITIVNFIIFHFLMLVIFFM